MRVACSTDAGPRSIMILRTSPEQRVRESGVQSARRACHGRHPRLAPTDQPHDRVASLGRMRRQLETGLVAFERHSPRVHLQLLRYTPPSHLLATAQLSHRRGLASR
jgi:hypothetical protein